LRDHVRPAAVLLGADAELVARWNAMVVAAAEHGRRATARAVRDSDHVDADRHEAERLADGVSSPAVSRVAVHFGPW
jgi:hypothetical protein